MRPSIPGLLAVALLAACARPAAPPAPTPLSEDECRALVRHELAIAMQALPPDQARAFAEATEQGLDEEVRKCRADRTISREYHACMLAARNVDAAKACIDAERDRRG